MLPTNGEMKECPKCKEVRKLEDFKDSSLMTRSGRFCKYCKGSTKTYEKETSTIKPPIVLNNKTCPRCGSHMVLRNGKLGKFYGCSRFPYCRSTIPA